MDFVLIWAVSLTQVRYLLVLMGPVGSCKHPAWVRRPKKQHKIKAPGYRWIIDSDTMSFLIWVVLPVGKAIQKQTTKASIRTVLIRNFLGGPMLMGGTGHETRWPFTLLFLSTVPTVGMMPSLRRTNTDMVQQSCQPRRLCRYEVMEHHRLSALNLPGVSPLTWRWSGSRRRRSGRPPLWNWVPGWIHTSTAPCRRRGPFPFAASLQRNFGTYSSSASGQSVELGASTGTGDGSHSRVAVCFWRSLWMPNKYKCAQHRKGEGSSGYVTIRGGTCADTCSGWLKIQVTKPRRHGVFSSMQVECPDESWALFQARCQLG